MNIIKKLINYNFVKDTNKAEYIVIHETDNKTKGANAEMHYRYFNSGNKGASVHYFVDNTQVIQTVEDKDTAWHVGDGYNRYGINNNNSIGIEICVNSDGDYAQSINKTLELTMELMKKHKIPLDKVVRHYDASRKLCPSGMSRDSWAGWTIFKLRLTAKLKDSEIPAYKLEGLQKLHKAGLVTDYNGWEKKLDEPLPAWAGFLILSRIYEAVKK